MDSLVYGIVAIALLIAFWSTIKRAGVALDKTIAVAVDVVDIVSDVSSDSMKTYSSKVSLNNAKVRGDMAQEAKAAKEVDGLATQKELDDLLAGI